MAERSDFLSVTMAVNGGYNHVLERNLLLLNLANCFSLEDCKNVMFVKLKGFNFSDSAICNSNWYATHPKKAAQVENVLSSL